MNISLLTDCIVALKCLYFQAIINISNTMQYKNICKVAKHESVPSNAIYQLRSNLMGITPKKHSLVIHNASSTLSSPTMLDIQKSI